MDVCGCVAVCCFAWLVVWSLLVLLRTYRPLLAVSYHIDSLYVLVLFIMSIIVSPYENVLMVHIFSVCISYITLLPQ